MVSTCRWLSPLVSDNIWCSLFVYFSLHWSLAASNVFCRSPPLSGSLHLSLSVSIAVWQFGLYLSPFVPTNLQSSLAVSTSLHCSLTVSTGPYQSLFVSTSLHGLCQFVVVCSGLWQSLLPSSGLPWSLVVSSALWQSPVVTIDL